MALMLPVILLLALAGGAAAERLPIKAYTIENGLAHNRVKRIVQDSRGFLWFCTSAGLSRFDGHQFTNYGVEEGLPGPSINDLLEASDGVYWVATNSDGVVRFDLHAAAPSTREGIRSRFSVVRVSDEPVANRVNVLYKDRSGTLWAGTDGGLFRMQEGADRAFHPVTLGIPSRPDIQVQVWSLVEDGAGSLWIGTKFGLVRRLQGGRMMHYQIEPASDGDTVAAVVIDAKGRLWLGHRSGLITFTDEPSTSSAIESAGSSRALPPNARRYTMADGLDSNTVLSLRQSADGRLWIRTFGSALTEFDGRNFRAYHVGQRAGDVIGSLTEDREGNLWLGTAAIGALKIMRHGWTTYDQADGLGDAIGSIFENQRGDLHVISSAWRVSRLDGTAFTTVRPGLPRTVTDNGWRVMSGVLQDHAGQWWVSTREGLYRFGKVDRLEDLARARPQAVYRTRDGLVNDDVTRLFEDSGGDIWIASWVPASDVLVRWERGTGQFHRYGQKDGLRPFTSAVTFAEDSEGGIWIGFREGGLARYRRGRFTMLAPADGLPPGGITSLYADRLGRLWVATSASGLCRIEQLADDRPRMKRYTRTDGLTTDLLLSVTGDLDGRIYVTGGRGIDRLDPHTGHINHYATAEGLSGSEFTTTIRDRHGALWFGTLGGLLRLTPGRERQAAPPPVLIGALRVAGRSRPLSALGDTAVSGLQFAPDQNNIAIDFFGLGFKPGETLSYKYKLEGASADWSAPAARRSVEFANLAPGAYRFLVRAVSTDGTESASPAAVAFTILPPLWRRWWFLALAAAMTSAAGYAVARYRHARVETLRESENQFRTLAETASDAIITIDKDSRIVLVNQMAASMFGYTREEMLGADLTMLMPGYLREHHLAGLARYRRTGQRSISWDAIAVAGLRKDGHEIPLEISFGEFTAKNRQFYTGIARDVTERKRAEEALRRSRDERFAELERVRKRIATDLHDDVGSSLTRISLLSEVVRRHVGGEAPVAGPLASIASLSRELVDAMSDIVWAINPGKDHLSDLSQRMRHFVSDLCTARQIDFRFHTPSTERDVVVGANVRREVFLLFKEAVNNMVRHSGCSHAELEFRIEGDRLLLRVADNGRGFDGAAAAAGHGLRSMRDRTEALGGHLDVLSHPGRGTTLTFVIPAKDRMETAPASPGAMPSPHEYAVTEPPVRT